MRTISTGRRLVSFDGEIGDLEFKLVIAGQQLVVDADMHRVAQVRVVAHFEPLGVGKVLKCLEHLVDRRRQRAEHACALDVGSALERRRVGGLEPNGHIVDHGHEEGAHKHLFRGLMVRLGMIQHAAVTLDVELSKAEGPLSSYTAMELSLLINAFYLNLSGGLDNLAWALAYQHNLFDQLDESGKGRRNVALFGTKFRKALRDKNHREMVNKLERFDDWNNDLRSFRDPSAHRIPLLVHPSIWSEQDVEEQKRLDTEAAKLFASGRDEEAMEKIFEWSRLGTFVPSFSGDVPQTITYHLGPKVTEDFEQWYRVVDIVFEDGFNFVREKA